MKIGLVSPYYMQSGGGVQTLIKDLKTLLESKKHQVIIIAPRPRQPDLLAAPLADGIFMLGVSTQINFKNPFHTTFPLATANRKLIKQFLKKENFDVLNIHEPWMPLLPYQILQEANCPVVGTTHARWPRSWFNKSLEKVRTPFFKTVLKKLDLITAVSEVAAKNVTMVGSDFNLTIIPNGINYPVFKQAILDNKKSKIAKPYLLYLNRLEKRKGPLLLLKAYQSYLKITQKPPLPLIIAGTGPDLSRLQTYVEENNLAKLVKFEGYVSEKRKLELFANAHVYLSPAPFGESFGIVLLEALVADLPILAGDNEGYRTVLKGLGSLALINPYQSQIFGQRLDEFCHDRLIRQSFKKWARQEIIKYDYHQIVNRYEEIFYKAVQLKK